VTFSTDLVITLHTLDIPLQAHIHDSLLQYTFSTLVISSAVTIIEIDIEIAIFHGDRMGSKSRSFPFDLRDFRWVMASTWCNHQGHHARCARLCPDWSATQWNDVSSSGVNASSKLGGGRSAEGRDVWGGVFPTPPGTPPPHRRGVWKGANFLFCDLKMAYFGEFWGAKFQAFLYRELPEWGLGRFCGKFWIFEQNDEKRHH